MVIFFDEFVVVVVVTIKGVIVVVVVASVVMVVCISVTLLEVIKLVHFSIKWFGNLQNSYNYYSNRTGNCVTNSRMYFDPNSTSNFNDPVNQYPDISSSTSPKKQLNSKNEPHSDLIVQNTSSFEQITSSLQDAEKNDSNLSKSETFQSTQLDTNSCENLVSIT